MLPFLFLALDAHGYKNTTKQFFTQVILSAQAEFLLVGQPFQVHLGIFADPFTERKTNMNLLCQR